MSSYNLIPVTDLTAVGFTGTVSTTAFTVNSATVTGAVTATNLLSPVWPTTLPSFTFRSDDTIGMFSRQVPGAASSPSVTLGFFIGNTTVVEIKGRENSAGSAPAFWLNGNFSTGQSIQIAGNGNEFSILNIGGGGQGAEMVVDNYYMERQIVGTTNGIFQNFVVSSTKFVLGDGLGTTLFTLIGTNASSPTSLGSIWAQSETDATNYWHFNKPGFLQQATTLVQPIVTRSNAHVTNLVAGITTVFVTLPISSAGLKYTVSNARAVANTVVVNPRAGETLQVFGLTKVAGASVAANAAFSSITFHCVTTSRWVATKQTGAWV